MHKVLKNQPLAEKIFRMEVEAPLIPPNYRPGQFIIIMADSRSERIPLTIVETKGNAVILIYQVVGRSTEKLSSLKAGDPVYGIVGPLGHASEIKKFGKVVCIGGGVGTAVIYPEIRALKDAGNHITSIIGSRSGDLLILKKEIAGISDELFLTTDDGSQGEKGLVTMPLEKILIKEKTDLVIAIGPVIMMKAVSGLTKRYSVKTIVSLNPIMVDGTGMCGACRVIVDNQTKFACVDGPEFDAHLVDFDNLLLRSRQYQKQEKEAHPCRKIN
ncbi:MAG: sulfide/dihydroorotate dehydrogenase-like FAD/NAD-binding protein [bacterium]|nr:sulfide/dihydroorotate dehydrogenase-like FAD/NAD-binding protein [bacterium]